MDSAITFAPKIKAQFVAYSDYLVLHKQVVMLTDLVNQLRGGLIEDGSGRLKDKITNTCQVTPDLPSPGPPLLHYHDAISTPAPTSKTFVNPILASITTSSTNLSPTSIDPIAIAKQAAQLLEKATRAVIERAPDDKTTQQNHKDSEFVKSIAARYNLPIPSQVYRHECLAASRPMKLQFSSKIERDNFVRGFGKIISTDKDTSAINPKIRVRRDLTSSELQTLYASRKFVYNENLMAKETKYLMNDISYKLNPKPRPFA